MHPREEIREIVEGMDRAQMQTVMRDLLEMADELCRLTSSPPLPPEMEIAEDWRMRN